MKTKSFIINPFIIITILLILCSCSSGPSLTDETIEKYIIAYRNLKKIAPELLNSAEEVEKGNLNAGQEGFQDVEKVITDAGFKDYAEFVNVNSKIAWAFSVLQATTYVDTMDKIIAKGEEDLTIAINDPNISEELRQKLIAARDSLKEEYTKNRKIAMPVLEGTKKFLTDKKSLEVVKKHLKELEAVYIEQP